MKKILLISSLSAIIIGFLLIGSGVLGLTFTYKNVVKENITTPDDASIPGAPVRGPFTLKAQADIIRTHTLSMTEGKTFAEMPMQIPKLDESGKPIVDEDGKPVMVANTARDTWITATTLITALNLGIIAYAFAGLTLLFGLFSVWIGGITFYIFWRAGGGARAYDFGSELPRAPRACQTFCSKYVRAKSYNSTKIK